MKYQRYIRVFTAILSLVLFLQVPVIAQKQDTVKKLSAAEFAEQIKTLPKGVVIDARTTKEFEEGHLKNAANFNVLAPEEFEHQIATLDKSTPVFVYCQSGKRSTVAANKLHAAGFDKIYELRGGIKEWRESKLNETTETASRMTRKQFEDLLEADKSVLVEFYTPSCEPCKKLENNLKAVSKKKGDAVKIIRINAETNPAITEDLFVGDVPVVHLYKNKHLTWAASGVVKKSQIRKHLK